MAWTIEITESATRQLEKLDKTVAKRIRRLDKPRSLGQALKGERFGELWKYRVGDYRLIAKIEDDRIVVLILSVGHRHEIYR